MPAAQRSALEMAYFEGLTHIEIAAKTGEPLGTIKTRIRTGLLALRKTFVACRFPEAFRIRAALRTHWGWKVYLIRIFARWERVRNAGDCRQMDLPAQTIRLGWEPTLESVPCEHT